MDPIDLIIRLAVAVAAGVAVGLERELNGHPAGVRTHIVVAVGAAMFTLTGAYGFADVRTEVPADPARVAAQVASGIGFLGAGAILRDGLSVRGLTTAGTVWLSASCGVAAGAGAFLEVAVGTALVMVTLVGVRLGRDRLWGRRGELRMTIRYQSGTGALDVAFDALRRLEVDVDSVEIGKDELDGHRSVAFLVGMPSGLTSTRLLSTVADAAAVAQVKLEAPR